jgi:hypothetical protein
LANWAAEHRRRIEKKTSHVLELWLLADLLPLLVSLIADWAAEH